MFVMLRSSTGARLLLNLDQVFAFTEDQAGIASAVSIGGNVLPLGMKLDAIAMDVLHAEDEEEGET